MIDHQTMLSKLSAEVQNSMTARSIDIWIAIYNYVDKNQYADCADADFIHSVQLNFKIAPRTISNHLRRMVRAGLLESWEGTVASGQIHRLFPLLTSSPPTRIIRYTLPGQEPPKTLYRRE